MADNGDLPGLDVQLAGRITPATRGCRVTVHTALFPRGPLPLTRPVLNRIMQASWDKHLLRIKEILEM